MFTPAQLQQRLNDIEVDLASRQNGYERAADDRARLTRDWERRLAICTARATGASAEVRKSRALVAAIEQDDLYERFTDAEARHEAGKVAVRVMETRATIGMSVLRSLGRA